MHKLFQIGVYLILLLQFVPAVAQDQRVASSNNNAARINSIIMPEESQVNVELLVTQILRQHHYRKIDLNDSLSSAILDNYLTALDPNEVYFNVSDIETFEQ